METFETAFGEVKYQGHDGVARTAYGTVSLTTDMCLVVAPLSSPATVAAGGAPAVVIPLRNVVLVDVLLREEYEAAIRAHASRNTLSTVLPRNQSFALQAMQEAQQAGQPIPGAPNRPPTRPNPQGGSVARYGGPPGPQGGDGSHGWGSR